MKYPTIYLLLAILHLFGCSPEQKPEPQGVASGRQVSTDFGQVTIQWREPDGSVTQVDRRVLVKGEGYTLEAPVVALGSVPREAFVEGRVGRIRIAERISTVNPEVMLGDRALRIGFLQLSEEAPLRPAPVNEHRAPRQLASSQGTWHFSGAWEWTNPTAHSLGVEWSSTSVGGFLWPRREHRLTQMPCDFSVASQDLPPWTESAEFRIVPAMAGSSLRALPSEARNLLRVEPGQKARFWVYSRGAGPARVFEAGILSASARRVKAYRRYTIDMKNAGHPYEPRSGCSSEAFGGAEVAGVFWASEGEEMMAPLGKTVALNWRVGAVSARGLLAPLREVAMDSWPIQPHSLGESEERFVSK